MPENSKHPDYDASLPAWQRARDVLAGEDAVKAAGVKYLPRLESQSDEEYEAYVARASFFGATARTLEHYLELVFRKSPVFAQGISERLNGFLKDCDGWGTSFVRYARLVLAEVLSVGRAGSLVRDGEGRGAACVSLWRAEDIINWEVADSKAGPVLTKVVLKDPPSPDGYDRTGGERVRVLSLVPGTEDLGRGGTRPYRCVQEIWAEADGEWRVQERVELCRDGVALSFIPFVFHGAENSHPEPGRLPLGEIIAANLDHYRLDADYKHGLHFTALPTAWVSGFDKGTALRIGSSTAWLSEVAGASAGFLEFSGAGLGHIEKAMEKVERRMALLGADMIEKSEESGPGARQVSGLGAVVGCVNESLSRVLEFAQAVPASNVGKGPEFAMNTDLAARVLSGEDINAVVGAWKAGGISRQTMLEWLKRGEVLPDGRTVAQERELIHGKVER